MVPFQYGEDMLAGEEIGYDRLNCFVELREELEKRKNRKFPYRDKVKKTPNYTVHQKLRNG